MKKYWKYFLIAIKGEQKTFTEGSVNKALFLLAIPMIMEMVMESLFALVDIFFVSRLGSEDAISTIGLTENFLYIIISIAFGISMPVTAMVARRIGENNKKAASDAAVQAIFLCLLISSTIGVFGFFYAEDLLRLMGGSEELIKEGLGYTRIILSLNVILMMLFVNNAIFRGAGDAAIAMRTLWLANGLNIILDPCLIFGLGPFPELGLKGAAIATCIGRGIGVLYQLWHLFNGRSIIVIFWKNLIIRLNIIGKLLWLSIGGAGQHIVASASWIFLARILTEFGSDVFAGYFIAIRLIMFSLLPSWGLAMAGATLVGQNLGANNPDRAEKSVWLAARYNMYFLLALSLIYLLIADPVIRVFSDNPFVIENGVWALRIICAGYIFYAYEMVIGQAFNGAGDTFTPTLLNLIAFWLLQIPLAYILAISLGFGPNGVYISISISSSVLAIMAIYIFRKGKWKKFQV
jgi:putative MATE family efflux protein